MTVPIIGKSVEEAVVFTFILSYAPNLLGIQTFEDIRLPRCPLDDYTLGDMFPYSRNREAHFGDWYIRRRPYLNRTSEPAHTGFVTYSYNRHLKSHPSYRPNRQRRHASYTSRSLFQDALSDHFHHLPQHPAVRGRACSQVSVNSA